MQQTSEESTGLVFELNGRQVRGQASATTRLSEVLRNELDCLDVKVGCNAGDCGACTVLLDGKPVCACMTAFSQIEGRHIETVAGLVEHDPVTRKLANAFVRHGAAQCGICTPGMMVSATSLLRDNANPTATEASDALGGVLCRCTGYRKIIDAVLDADTSSSSDCTARTGTVGESIQRLDGQLKVQGHDAFGDDVAPADAWVVRVIRSPFHHAKFSIGDTEQWLLSLDGIELVLTADDIPGEKLFGVIPPFIDQPVFAENTVRYKGEPVAAVVGRADVMATLDSLEFPVTWTELSASLTPIDSMADTAASLHPSDAKPDNTKNVMCKGFVQRGDVKAALGSADVIVEGQFSTGFIEHAYIEPEAGFAKRVGDRIEIHGCTQSAYMNRDAISGMLALDKTAVRIVPTAVGGGFGSKLDLSYQPYIALAAWRMKGAVRMTYTRIESMQSTTKRHPSNLLVRIGASKDGRLCGFEFDGLFNTGAYASWGPTVANRVPVHASGPYLISDYRARAQGVYTHCAPAGAFRGFGVPQAAIAQESLFDELANRLNIDRLEFRMLNALDNHQPTVTGQIFESSVGIRPCLEALQAHWSTACDEADKFNHDAVNSGSPLRRGVGVASGWYGCGNTSLPNPSTIKAGIKANGEVCLHQGAVDIGQGSTTVITQIFAQTLGVPVHGVKLLSADSDITPDAGKTSASRQTFVSGNAARLSALAMRAAILRLSNCDSNSSIGITGSTITLNAGETGERLIDLSDMPTDSDGYVFSATESYDPPTEALDANGQGKPYAIYGYAAQMVELSVDIGLGTIKLHRFVAAHDVGKAINPQLVEGQIQGGIAQGIGLALMEEFIPGRTENLHDYLIPTVGDVPPIESIIVEVPDSNGPFGAKGLGEHVLIPTAPSILNAIQHASGARICHLPATPDKVLSAIQQAGLDYS